jgi:predicted aminopeptidase
LRLSKRPAIRTAAGVFATVVAVLALVFHLEVEFLLRAGYEEARILLGRRSISGLLSNPSTPPELAARFQMVLDARDFAAGRLGLAAGETYTTYSDVGPREELLWVITASRKDRLEPYRWWYPVVGSVPYKGFFHKSAALAEQRRLEGAGYDTYLRPATAFSTLGWFNDPLLSTAMEGDSADLVSTVIHEISHNTLWAPGSVRFNESYANFVGLRGAEVFFASRGDLETARQCAAIWRDEKRLGSFYEELAQGLEALYGSRLSGRALESRRQAVFRHARSVLAGPLDYELEVYSGKAIGKREINNAVILAARFYRTGLEDFDRALASRGGDLRASVTLIRQVVKADRHGQPVAALASASFGRPHPRSARASWMPGLRALLAPDPRSTGAL